MTPTQAIKEIDTVIEQIISKTEKDKAEKLKKAYEIVKQDYQDKINLSVIRTDHSLYLQEKDMKIKLKPCTICSLPFPSTSLFKLRNLKVCANCYVQNKRMFREW